MGSPAVTITPDIPAQQQGVTITPDPPAPPPTFAQQLKDHMLRGLTLSEATDPYVGFAKDIAGTAANASSLINKIPVVGETLAPKAGVDAFQKAVEPTNAAQKIGAVASSIGQMAVPVGGGEQAIAKALPSTEHAGQLFGDVASVANKVPVELSNSQDAILKMIDWQKKTQLGPTINKFLNRVTNPKLGELTYEEGRDFYQLLGRMSADETMKIAPPVRKALTQMVVGLKQDVGAAAETVGKGQQYFDAMKEFASAKRLEDLSDAAKDVLWKAVKYGIPSTAAGYLAKQGIDLATQK